MSILHPTRHGKIYDFANQYIETSFSLLFIPTQSYFVNRNTNSSLEIPISNKSLKNYYYSVFLVISGILFFLAMVLFTNGISGNDNNIILAYLPSIVSGSLILSGFIAGHKIGKPDKKQIKKRTIFQSIVDINAMPEWLNIETAKEIYMRNSHRLPKKWKQIIIEGKMTSDDFFLFYTMLSYENRIEATGENKILLNYLEKRIKE